MIDNNVTDTEEMGLFTGVFLRMTYIPRAHERRQMVS